MLVLTGIVEEDGGYRAYFEDLGSSAVVRLSAGDAVARGEVAEIGMDAISYDKAGQLTRVEVGHDLTGRVVNWAAARALPSVSPSVASAAPSTSPTTRAAAESGGEAINATDPNLIVEQRLRLRRAQELNR